MRSDGFCAALNIFRKIMQNVWFDRLNFDIICLENSSKITKNACNDNITSVFIICVLSAIPKVYFGCHLCCFDGVSNIALATIYDMNYII